MTSSLTTSSSSCRPVLVYYHIPGDHDDAEHPNAFPVFKQSSLSTMSDPTSSIEIHNVVRLRDIRSHFPLPGQYHFRFKVKHENSFFWVDVPNDDSIVPLYNSKVVAKVLRIDWPQSTLNQNTSTTKSTFLSNEAHKAVMHQAKLQSERPLSHSLTTPTPKHESSEVLSGGVVMSTSPDMMMNSTDMLFLDGGVADISVGGGGGGDSPPIKNTFRKDPNDNLAELFG